MSRQFSIPTVLRMVPNRLLQEFFARLGHDGFDIDWDRLGDRETDPIVTALVDLPRKEQDAIEGALRNVFDLACETGINALFEAAEKCGEFDLPAAMPQNAGPYEKAMWAWLNRPAAFEKATLFYQVDALSWWRKRNDLPRVTPDTSPEARKKLENELADFLVRQQGRGQVCTVETLQRDGNLFYYFAYPDDFVQNVTTHDEDGHLAPRTFRQTFVIVFAFDRSAGSLELFAKVPPRLKARLEEIFSDTVLHRELPLWQPEAAYELNVLKDRRFELATDPRDQLRVAIRKLRLAFHNSGRRLVLEITEEGDSVYRMIDECLNAGHASLNDLSVTLATFRFEFLPLEGRKPGTLTFDVAFPNSCSLRNQRPERIELAQKYLRHWGIDGARSTADSLEEAGI